MSAIATNPPRAVSEVKVVKETSAPVKVETVKKDAERRESVSAATSGTTKKESKPEEQDRKSESVPPAPPSTTVTTKSGRASKPSTPALATFQEAARPRSSRNADGTSATKKSQKKGTSTIHALVAQLADDDTNSSMQGDEEEPEIDADEPTYCYCNSVSYGEMVACDAEGCPKEWFHLECVGLKVAPSSKSEFPSHLAVIKTQANKT